MMGAMICCVYSDDSDADTVVSVDASSSFCGVNSSYSDTSAKKVTYTLSGNSTYYFEAKLLDSSGTSTGQLSPSSGSLTGTPAKRTVTVTAPLSAGDYTFNVKFYENSTTKDTVLAEKNVPLKVVDPIVLTFSLKNAGESAVTFNAYYKVNGEKVDDSVQAVTIEAGSTKDVTYNYYVRDTNDTKYSLETDDQIIRNSIEGLGVEKTFYAHDEDYSLITGIVVFTLIVLAIVTVYIYRKPVINKGKPKGRR